MIRHVNNRAESAPVDVANELPLRELAAIVGGSGGTAGNFTTVGLGLRKSAGNQSSGVMFLA